MENIRPTYISLFSSAGIGCYGFNLEGFDCIASNELVERRINIQKYNNKCKYQSGYICGDLNLPEIKEALINEIDYWKQNENLKDIDIIIATPPCQGMSVANHKKATDEIIRNSLVVESIKIVGETKPKFFVFENVSAFMKTNCTDVDGQIKPISESIELNLSKYYLIHHKIINFKNYGSCSSRTRTLLIGVRKDLSNNIVPIELFPDFQDEKTLRDNIGELKPLKIFGEIDNEDIYHAFRIYPEHMQSWISELKEGQSAFENTDINRIPHQIIDGKIVYNKQKNSDKYRRQVWDKIGPCIHTRNDQFASQNTIHPSDNRVFSIRELMKMMTVPDDFKWVETEFDELNNLSDSRKRTFLKKEEIKIRQCLGEAVPTIIFQSIAKKVKLFLSKRHFSTLEIYKQIDKYSLTSDINLFNYIEKNKSCIGINSLSKITEFANAKRNQNAAFFTDKSLVNEIVCRLPVFEKDIVRILEPSVGTGNFIYLIVKKYQYIKELIIDVVDIDFRALKILKILVREMDLPKNVHINYICADFLKLEHYTEYDLVIGNPPFNKLSSSNENLKEYRKNSYNNKTTNTYSFFLEKAISTSKYVALITPKSLLNVPEFELTRNLLENKKIEIILDFGETGFKGVLIETIAVFIDTIAKPTNTLVISVTEDKKFNQLQSYIFDKKYPYWIIYRNKKFDEVASKMHFGVFDVFRDRQITNKYLKNSGEIRVIKSRNISNDGLCLININDYDSYISITDVELLAVYKFLNRDDVYLTPNMTYKPRVMQKPKGLLVNGSTAILIPKNEKIYLSHKEMLYYSSEEYRDFYKTARNFQTRSLNIDSKSVFFFGKLIEESV